MSVRNFLEQWRAAIQPAPSYKFDLQVENYDGSITELRGLTVQSISYDVVNDQPSIYRRVGSTVFIDGPNALADMDRAEKWARESDVEMLPDGDGNTAMLFFEREDNAVVAMLALA